MLINWIIEQLNKLKKFKDDNNKFIGDSEPCDNGGCDDCICGFNSKGIG